MMNTSIYSVRLLRKISFIFSILASVALLTSCATTNAIQSFDFGTVAQSPNASKVQLNGVKWIIADIRVPASLDGNAMLYRLNYDNPQELKPFAQSRWSATPAQLFHLRLKQAINHAGGAALSASDGIKDVPQLRIELDEFAQHFSAPQRSQARIQLRVGLVHKNTLLAQKAFTINVDAPTSDARGGALAMSRASDEMILQILQWAHLEQQSAKML